MALAAAGQVDLRAELLDLVGADEDGVDAERLVQQRRSRWIRSVDSLCASQKTPRSDIRRL